MWRSVPLCPALVLLLVMAAWTTGCRCNRQPDPPAQAGTTGGSGQGAAAAPSAPAASSSASPAAAPVPPTQAPSEVTAVAAPAAVSPSASDLVVQRPVPPPVGYRGLRDAGPLLVAARGWLGGRLGALNEAGGLTLVRGTGAEGRLETLQVLAGGEAVVLRVPSEGLHIERRGGQCRVVAGDAVAGCEAEEAAAVAALAALAHTLGPWQALRVEALHAVSADSPARLQLAAPGQGVRWALSLLGTSGRVESLDVVADRVSARLTLTEAGASLVLLSGGRVEARWRVQVPAPGTAQRVVARADLKAMGDADAAAAALARVAASLGGRAVGPPSFRLAVGPAGATLQALEMPLLVAATAAHPQLHRLPALSQAATAVSVRPAHLEADVAAGAAPGCVRAQLLGPTVPPVAGQGAGSDRKGASDARMVVAIRPCAEGD